MHSCLLPLSRLLRRTQAKMTGQNEAQKTFGDRCFMNLVEQAAFWLSSLWMCAFFVGEEVRAHSSAAPPVSHFLVPAVPRVSSSHLDLQTAFRIGTVYVALRYLYPIMW